MLIYSNVIIHIQHLDYINVGVLLKMRCVRFVSHRSTFIIFIFVEMVDVWKWKLIIITHKMLIRV